MTSPEEMIRRARENRRRREIVSREPAPATEVQIKPVPLQAMAHHGAYTELMRSHDRVSTRHIGKQN